MLYPFGSLVSSLRENCNLTWSNLKAPLSARFFLRLTAIYYQSKKVSLISLNWTRQKNPRARISGILMPQASEINYKEKGKNHQSWKQHTLCRLRVFSLICSAENFSEMGGSSSTLQSLSGCSMNPWACSYANLQHDLITDRPNHSS